MPELPEIEVLKRRLQQVLPGKTLSSVEQFHPKSFQGLVERIQDQQITQVSRRAKILQISFQNDYHLLTHLKMTGQLIFIDDQQRLGGGHPTADWIQDLPSKHTRISYWFADGSRLHFNDQRLFGWMRVMSDDQVAAEFAKYAPDINTDQVTFEYLWPLLQRRTAAIKLALLDPRVVSGLGNIYVCDALNLAEIGPERPARSLSQAEVRRLLEAAQQIIELGIEHNGTTFDGKYVNIDGLAGQYQQVARVYSRQGQPCRNCGTEIVKIKQAGRGTYFCSGCQV